MPTAARVVLILLCATLLAVAGCNNDDGSEAEAPAGDQPRSGASSTLTDLAVLRVDRDGLPAARFAKGLPEPGALAIAIGNPLGFEETVTAGVISGLDRALPTGGQTPELVGLLQTDAPISPGNSGDALVDSDGRVTGINVAHIPPEQRAVSIGFAIPSPAVREVVEQLLDDGKAEHAHVGTSVRPSAPTPEAARRVES